MKRQSGIYKIQSVIKPERIYIGSAVNITSRWALHLRELGKNNHHSSKLQNHVNKYGIADLSFIIIEPCFPEWLIMREQYYMDALKPYFNICKIAGSALGIKRSVESIAKGVAKRKGMPVSIETRKKMSDAKKGCIGTWLGKHHSEITKHKISEKLKGQVISESTRKKLSIASKGNKSQLGKKQSEETINKRMVFHRGKITSHETKIKMRDAALKNLKAKRIKDKIEGNIPKQKKYTFKRNKPSWNKGRKMSEESKAKLSKSRMGSIPWNKGINNKVADKIIEQITNQESSLCN